MDESIGEASGDPFRSCGQDLGREDCYSRTRLL